MADIVKKMLGSTGGSSDNVLYGDEIMSSRDLLKIMGGDADSIFEDSMPDPVEYTNELMTQSELSEIAGGDSDSIFEDSMSDPVEYTDELTTQSKLSETAGGDSEKGSVESLFYQGSDMTGGEAATYEESDMTGGDAATYEESDMTGDDAAAYEDAIDKVLTHDPPNVTGGECRDIFSKKCTNAMTLRDFKACIKKTKGRKNNIVCSDDVTKALHKFSKSLQL